MCGLCVKHFRNKIWRKRTIFILTNGGCMWHNMGVSRADKKNMAYVINDIGHTLENQSGYTV